MPRETLRNLDTYLLGKQGIKEIYLRQSGATDIAIIEGVMGLLMVRMVEEKWVVPLKWPKHCKPVI